MHRQIIKFGTCCLVLTLLSLSIRVRAQKDELRQNPDVASLVKSCSEFEGGGNIAFTGPEVLDGRYPSSYPLQVSDNCKMAADSRVKAWIREDVANWDLLASQACSAALGWVELTPNTCSAGGPPPICKVNHWIRKPSIAADSWKQTKEEARAARSKQMVEEACSCYLSNLQIKNREDVQREPATSSRVPDNTYLIPCAGNTCPPGFGCYEGICRPSSGIETKFQKATEFTAEKLTGVALDAASKKALAVLSDRLALLLSSMTGKVVFGVFGGLLDAKPLSLYRNGYKSTATRIYDLSAGMVGLIKEMEDFRNGRPSRSSQYIAADMATSKKSLSEQIRMLSEYHNGVVRERELCYSCCYNVFEFQHQEMIKAYSALMGLSAVSWKESNPNDP